MHFVPDRSFSAKTQGHEDFASLRLRAKTTIWPFKKQSQAKSTNFMDFNKKTLLNLSF